MTASTNAWYLFPSTGLGGTGVISGPSGAVQPEEAPAWLWGQGTPAAIVPFTTVNKGSLYSELNATDDNTNLWMKVDEGGDAADWVLQGNTGVIFVLSTLYDISGTSSEQVIFHAVTACEILEVGLLWEEATDTAGADAEDMTIGTSSGGAQIVAATKFAVAQASGSYQALDLVTGVLAAGTSVFAHHDLVAENGTCRILMKIRVEA